MVDATFVDVLNDILNPMSLEPADPFSIKLRPKYSLLRLAWTTHKRLLDQWARWEHTSFARAAKDLAGSILVADIGEELLDTAVTSGQLGLLSKALLSVHGINGEAVEIGCYRGVTTVALAEATKKTVFAIDPYLGYGGSERDYAMFEERTKRIGNITHLRMTSGQASRQFEEGSLCFAFIDAVHDVSNCWFDFVMWSKKLARSGLIALHDVDEFSGVGFTVRRILSRNLPFVVWGYCPNLIVLKKL